jgi:hypothetical protein
VEQDVWLASGTWEGVTVQDRCLTSIRNNNIVLLGVLLVVLRTDYSPKMVFDPVKHGCLAACWGPPSGPNCSHNMTSDPCDRPLFG